MQTISMLRAHLARLWGDQRAATAIEYAMIAAGVGAAIVASVYALGTQVDVLYNKIANVL